MEEVTSCVVVAVTVAVSLGGVRVTVTVEGSIVFSRVDMIDSVIVDVTVIPALWSWEVEGV